MENKSSQARGSGHGEKVSYPGQRRDCQKSKAQLRAVCKERLRVRGKNWLKVKGWRKAHRANSTSESWSGFLMTEQAKTRAARVHQGRGGAGEPHAPVSPEAFSRQQLGTIGNVSAHHRTRRENQGHGVWENTANQPNLARAQHPTHSC